MNCTNTHRSMHTQAHTRVHAHTSIHTSTCTHEHKHTHEHVNTSTRTHEHTRACTCMNTHTLPVCISSSLILSHFYPLILLYINLSFASMWMISSSFICLDCSQCWTFGLSLAYDSALSILFSGCV